MGLFNRFGNTSMQDQPGQTGEMAFRRMDDDAAAIQRFADMSLPKCPFCGGAPFWKLHIANVTTSMFPIQEVDRYYYLKCQCCGGILHTRYHAIGSSLPRFVLDPNPRDGSTRMTVDDTGASEQSRLCRGESYSIRELNQFIL